MPLGDCLSSETEQKQLLRQKFETYLKQIEPFQKIIPNDLLRSGKKAMASDDHAEITRFYQETSKIIQGYGDMIHNPLMNQGETIQWYHEEKKGVFHKEVDAKWVITNFRAMKVFPVTKERPKESMFAVGLALADVTVMNRHSKSSGNRVGTYTYGRGLGVGSSLSSSTSRSYGDLVFVIWGKESLRFQGISDPQGVKNLIGLLQKQLRS